VETGYERQRKIFEEETSHMEPQNRWKLWSLLERYHDTRKEPKVARVKYAARFTVHGRPFKARVRHYEPEMREELDKQVKKLELGDLRRVSGPRLHTLSRRKRENGGAL
ncbi:hypothetical protein GNI_112610, partial [Gregarina niphandrodes]